MDDGQLTSWKLLGNFLLSRSVLHIRSSDDNPVMSGEKRLAMKSFYLDTVCLQGIRSAADCI